MTQTIKQRLQINLRLTSGLRLLVAVLIFLGGFCMMQMVQLANWTEQLYNHPFLVSTATLRISEELTHMHLLVEQVALVRTMPALESLIQELNDRHAKVLQDLDTVAERFLGDPQQVVAVRQGLTTWIRVRDALVALHKAGDPDQIRFFAETLPEESKQLAHLDQLVEGLTTSSYQKAEQFIQAARRTRDQTLVLALVVVACCVALSLLFGRASRLPLQNVIGMLSASASQMAASINQQERIANQQAAAVTETTVTMEELDASSRQASEQAIQAANGAQQALELAQQGIGRTEEAMKNMVVLQDSVGEISQRMRLLSEQTGQIRTITDLVTDFANETRMLAVNAAVEAVRAGVHGKGFAVLAVETRKLADESKQSAGQIHELVREIQKSTDSTLSATEASNRAVEGGMSSSHGSAESLRGVVEAVEGASQEARQISLNVRQQAAAIRQVTEAIQSINLGSKETAAGMSQLKTGVQILNDAAQTLKRMV